MRTVRAKFLDLIDRCCRHEFFCITTLFQHVFDDNPVRQVLPDKLSQFAVLAETRLQIIDIELRNTCLRLTSQSAKKRGGNGIAKMSSVRLESVRQN